ncbi:MAG: DUF1648 domain-containing protein [Cyanosarcina radialis HA8281-LM2]|jgi:uncharacterized membrane protein|nr:DUF1648 domain-containing protein [Cyanosarcina radialis HA8281-LM2]
MKSQRPIISLPKSQQETILNLVAIAGLVAVFTIAIRGWSVLPETIPTHFDIAGKADGWGSKSTIWLFPILGTIVYVGFTILRRYPHTFNYPVAITEENAAKQYQIAVSLLDWLKAEFVWQITYIVWLIIEMARTGASGLSWLLLPAILITIFGTVGFYLWQAYQNK